MSKTTVSLNIETQPRVEGQNPRQARAEGMLPITLYSKAVESKSLLINAHAFKMAYRGNQDATFELSVDGKKVNAIVKSVQIDYVLGQYLNVEFQAV